MPFSYKEVRGVSFERLNAKFGTQNHIGLVATKPIIKLDGCDLTIGYEPAELYVASELSGCLYRHVKEHEEGHVRIYEKHLAALKEGLVGKSLDEAKKLLHEVRSAHSDHDADVASENARACNGKLRSILNP